MFATRQRALWLLQRWRQRPRLVCAVLFSTPRKGSMKIYY
ncbi:hypothetical protein BLL52_1670 [Rhodoferax antarcticus ANT.BR]|uniref:Uncharacterized protein n=1 Tax=Rhodoferax antarcticus ANT.BR TaxID=1111071 RepID=A0A1Q8YFU8_9BURK|nr:hypothetical protein BLL52_1670 [Rhodoferax antarcticus ANT.BR]